MQSATTVIQQLHTFSRKQVLAARVIDLNPLCERVRGMLTRLIDAGIRVEAELTDALGHVRVDPALFEQVIINLAINARDAMPGGGRLTLSTANAALDEAAARARSLPAGDFVVLTVKDTGVGMSPEVQAHLFEPFFTTKPAGDGSGLGLAACHGVVQQAGGAIGVESELGKGTTFRIFLPRVYDAVEREREEVARAGASPPRGSETILFVEDEPLIRGPVARLLNRLGYRVLIASSGEEAMRLAERFGPIALLFTDIVMPGMGGVELSSLLSAASPGLKTLFTSGYAPESITGDGGLDVRKSFIGKPYSLPVLAERLRSLLDARQTG